MEVEFCTIMSSLVWLVTTESDFVRKEGTCLISYQNASLDNRGGGGGGGIKTQEPRGRSDIPFWKFYKIEGQGGR